MKSGCRGLYLPSKRLLIVSSGSLYNRIISCFDVIRKPQVPEGYEVLFNAPNEYLDTVLTFPAASLSHPD